MLVVAAVYVVLAWRLAAPATFWSSDNSVRFVQLESLRLQGYREIAAVYPAADLDPEHRFYPIAEGFAYRRGDRVYLSYPWTFPLLAAPFYGGLGHVGLLVVPAASALAAVWMVAAEGARDHPVAGLAAGLLLGLASPLVVYAAVFWDHSLVAALGCAAVLLVRNVGTGNRDGDWPAVGAGLLLGLGPWFRNEMYLFAAAVLGGLWASGARRRIPWVLLGAGIILAPLWAYNFWWFGHPLGYKGRAVVQAAAEPGFLGYLRNRVFVAYDALLSVEHYTRAYLPERVPEAALAALCLVGAVAVLRAGLEKPSSALVVVGGVLLAGVGAGLYILRLPVMGLLPSAPFVALSWLRTPADARDRFLWSLVVCYVAGVLTVGSVGGLQWGPRYLLPVLPPLAILTARSVGAAWTRAPELRPALAAVLGGVLLSGTALQSLGVRFIRHSLVTVRAIEDALRATPYEVVATGYEQMFRLLGHLYFQKKLMVVDSRDELRDLVRLLASRRVAGWTYVPRYATSFDPRVVERWTSTGPWRFRLEEDRTPMVVEFGGPRPIRLLTYRGGP